MVVAWGFGPTLSTEYTGLPPSCFVYSVESVCFPCITGDMANRLFTCIAGFSPMS